MAQDSKFTRPTPHGCGARVQCVGAAAGGLRCRGESGGREQRLGRVLAGSVAGVHRPIAFLVSLFNHSVGIYEVHNNGAWYDFGYIVGLTIFFSGGTAGGARTRPRKKRAQP
ncbi:hypothetical protein [Terrabacter lapilli]|uniref:hypothetical protein n=1 Tax=Terrabacter lapilli TaxID=436231 RepID=UPI0031D5FDEB